MNKHATIPRIKAVYVKAEDVAPLVNGMIELVAETFAMPV